MFLAYGDEILHLLPTVAVEIERSEATLKAVRRLDLVGRRREHVTGNASDVDDVGPVSVGRVRRRRVMFAVFARRRAAAAAAATAARRQHFDVRPVIHSQYYL